LPTSYVSRLPGSDTTDWDRHVRTLHLYYVKLARLCELDHKNVDELVNNADDKLFSDMLYNKQRVLNSPFPGTTETKY